ncbi:hypothetical protein EWM64_g9007 [Hericium alpestre]|uniref:Uncharacterized protein n=1 Tax=Hericium alpestre TaxID=135208 RepID=A0A4Y9ZM14_9AGAM|nr:hypothetical protein EWM64_g9007 [Hericium alpestre]
MQRFRLQDLGSGSSARSKSRLSGSATQPDANGGKKGKGKAEPSLEEKQISAKRKREADRQQAYRDGVGSAFDELHAETYPDEEKSTLARSDHVKQQCMLDAARQLKTLRTEKAALEGRVTDLASIVKEKSHALAAAEHRYWKEIGQLSETVVDLERRLRAETKFS